MLSPENHLFYIRDPGALDPASCKMVLYSSPMRKEDAFLQLLLLQVPDTSSTDHTLPHFPSRTEVTCDALRSEDALRGSLKLLQEKKVPFLLQISVLCSWGQSDG